MYKKNIMQLCAALLALFAVMLISTEAVSKEAKTITLIQLSDAHGNLQPHAGIFETTDGEEYYGTQSGGLAKAKTLINDIREENPDSLLLAVGDTTHGSAEVLFTMGDAIMPALNAMGIDAYTPGNWDFGYGPAVFRHRFAPRPPYPPIPANAKVMVDAYDGDGVTAAEFPTLAINLYNKAPIPAPLQWKRVLDAYKIFDVAGHKIAVIGITSSILEQQSPLFSIGLRFTQGTEELPAIIDEVKEQQAEVIVVLSELGLAQNVQIGREFDDVDVILSAHTHEAVHQAIIADKDGVHLVPGGQSFDGEMRHRLRKGGTIVVEAGEDLYLGRLDITVTDDGDVKDAVWNMIPVDDSVPEDSYIASLVVAAEEPFIAGKDGKVERHTFLPGGFCPDNECGDTCVRGIQLVDDLDTVVGYTEAVLHRHDVLEGVMNNFIADAIRETTNDTVVNQTTWHGVDVSMTNGFRFDTPVLTPNEAGDKVFYDGRKAGEITLRDLFSYFPVAPAVAVAEFSGKTIESSLDSILKAVFNRNPYLQRGGWYLGLSNITQKIDLVRKPFSASDGNLVDTLIGGQPIDSSRKYVFASCWGQGFPLGRICRSEGGHNTKFFELSDPDNYNSPLTITNPKVPDQIIVGAAIRQAPPDAFFHPVHALRRYLDILPGKTITNTRFGLGRVTHVNAKKVGNPKEDLPESTVIPGLVQPIEGAGPDFAARISCDKML